MRAPRLSARGRGDGHRLLRLVGLVVESDLLAARLCTRGVARFLSVGRKADHELVPRSISLVTSSGRRDRRRFPGRRRDRARCRDPPAWCVKNGVKTWGRSSAEIPMPVSETRTSISRAALVRIAMRSVPAVRHRVDRVEEEIQEELLQLVRIAAHGGRRPRMSRSTVTSRTPELLRQERDRRVDDLDQMRPARARPAAAARC